MPITTIQPASVNQRPTLAPRPNQDHSFAALLDSYGLLPADPSSPTEEMTTEATVPTPAANSAQSPLIPLGRINAEAPSISHLLINNPTFRHECWEILSAKVNQGKAFTTMQPGMTVSLNPATKELVWTEPQNNSGPTVAPVATLHSAKTTADGQIVLGTIKPDTPTISHLLKSDPRFTDQAWKIIFSAANRNKPYASLQPGTVVSINPQTQELSFRPNDAQVSTPQAVTAAEATVPVTPAEIEETPIGQKTFAERLVGSVKSYLGQPYNKIDCYGLVIRGLEDQGVQYGGANGLFQRLEQLARKQGLAKNAYQTGEGLIEVAGHKVFDESFTRVKDTDRQSAEVMKQLEPILQEGMILSFSTRSQGHTGVIAKKDNQWTYVNSGVIDHQVNGGKVSRRVGEETLAEEIKNWFVLAKRHGTSLKVSGGLFDTQKLKAKASMAANNQPDGEDTI